MAYQNIPVTDGYQVVQQIANFAAGIGWTVHRDDDISGSLREVTLSAAGYDGYVSIAGTQSKISLNGHRGYSSILRWNNQPDQFIRGSDRYTIKSVDLRINPITSVYLFGGMTPTPHIYAAIEVAPGYYRHITIGHFVKFGTSLGGMFWDGSASPTRFTNRNGRYDNHRAPFLWNDGASASDYDAKGGFDCQDQDGNPKFATTGYYNNAAHLKGGHLATELQAFNIASPIAFNTRTPLITPLVWVESGGLRPFGTPPNFRYVNLTYFEAGDEITIGGDVWKVFPWARRKASNFGSNPGKPEDEATDMFGVAYLRA